MDVWLVAPIAKRQTRSSGVCLEDVLGSLDHDEGSRRGLGGGNRAEACQKPAIVFVAQYNAMNEKQAKKSGTEQ